MQTPSASDPSFKAFLDKLKEQNGGGILAQKETTKGIEKTNESLGDLKDETSSVRDSLREGLHDVSDDIIELQDQLDTANDTLSEIAAAVIGSKESIKTEMLPALEGIKEAITGLKAAVQNVGSDVGKDIDSGHLVATIGAIGANTNKLQDEQLKELSLVRKLTEGSVEYDKEAAQYRNTSGRDVESKVSGKTSKDGGFIDFETARDTLSGQGERARKENKVNLITSVTSTRPGKATSEALGADLGSSEGTSKAPEVAPAESSRNTSIKRARRERDSVTGNVEKGGAAGNTKDTDEDKSKFQGLFKEIESGFKFFMTDGLSEKPGHGIFQTPSKEVEKKDRETKVSSPRQENPEADNVTSTGEIQADAAKSDLELSKQMLDTTREQLTELKAIREALAPSTPKELTEQKGAPSSTTEKEKEGGGSLLGDLASGAVDMLGKGKGVAGKAAGMGGKILGGLGKAARFLGPAAAVAGAAYSGFQGYQNTESNFDLKEGEDATVGQKTASTLGGVASGLTFGLLDEKTAAQGIHKAGAAVGDAASAAGNFIGDKASSIGGAVSGFFGGIGNKVKDVYNGGIGLNDQAKGAAMADQKVGSNQEITSSDISSGGVTKSERSITEGVTAEKSVLGSTFLGGLFTAKGKESGSFLGTDTKESEVTGKVEGKVIDKSDTQYGRMMGKRISGGLLGKDTYKVSSEMSGTGGDSAEYDTEVTKHEYNQLQELNAKGDVEGARKKLASIKAAKAAALEPSGVDAMGNVTGATPTATGKDVVQASTENKDMERDAKGKGGANNTVVSNNVSSNNTTKIVPMKASPRPEYTGSSLDRYTSRITVY